MEKRISIVPEDSFCHSIIPINLPRLSGQFAELWIREGRVKEGPIDNTYKSLLKTTLETRRLRIESAYNVCLTAGGTKLSERNKTLMLVTSPAEVANMLIAFRSLHV